jgi:hypothetical protein
MRPLAPEVFDRTLQKATQILRSKVPLTNSILRVKAGLRYDESIRFFRSAVLAGILERRGAGPRTHYVWANNCRATG